MITNYFKLCKCGQLLKWSFEAFCLKCQENYAWEYEEGDRVYSLRPLTSLVLLHTSGTVEKCSFRAALEVNGDSITTNPLLPQYLVYFGTGPTDPNTRMWVYGHEIAAGRPPKTARV